MQTRSGKRFSPWDDLKTFTTPRGFDFAGLLANPSGQTQECEDTPSPLPFDAAALSPLTSPEASPSPSPSPSLVLLSLPLLLADGPNVPEAPLNAAKKKNAHNKRSGRANRKRKRQQEQVERANKGPSGYQPRTGTRRKHTHEAKELASELVSEGFPIAKTGYVAVRQGNSDEAYCLDDLVGPGSRFRFELIQWDGRETHPILDSAGRIVAVLVGCPADDPTWQATHVGAARLIQQVRSSCTFEPSQKHHRRGHFPALPVGISHGGGQLRPGNLATGVNTNALASLTASPQFIRLAGFASAAFATWAPKLYRYYSDHTEALLSRYTALKRPFPNSIWASTTFNFGPSTVCLKHIDSANLPFGWCGITALGEFDPKKGGHLVLWDICRVIEFPPGSTILIPSAALTHSNIPVQNGERRYSFTQYTAGGIFRWVNQGFRTRERHLARLNARKRAEESLRLARQLEAGLELFSTLTELRG